MNLRETTDDNAQQNLTYLSRFVHLPNVTKIEFGSTYDVDQWKDIQCILKYVYFRNENILKILF